MSQTTVRHHFDADVERMFALVTDPEFLRRRAEALGERDVAVTVDRANGQLKIEIKREVEQNMPAFMKKFFAPRQTLIDRQAWTSEGGAHISDWTVQVGDGNRIQLRGKLTLEPAAGGGCDYTERFTASANVMLIGSRIERFVLDETEASIRKQIEFTGKELGG
jgi:hypothetical protein